MPADSTLVRYFAPDFFSPFYFPPLDASRAVEAPVRYFALEYFSPFYFPPLIPRDPGSGAVDAKTHYRDADALAAVAGALRSTREFVAVFVASSDERRPGGADLTPAAVVTPDSWEEIDDADPDVVLRQVAFSVTLVVHAHDPAEGVDRLDRLTCASLNAVNGSDLGGCLPPLTRLRRGAFDPRAVFPEHRAVLRGEFAYLIPSPNGHCDSP